MKKVALISLGCAKNLVDSEVMLGYLHRSGYNFVTKLDRADIIIINTCGFIKAARKESLEAMRKAVCEKKKATEKIIAAVGCYVEREKDTLKKKFPDIDIWMGVNDFDKIVNAIEGLPFESAASCFLYDHTSPRHLSTPAAWTYVKISEGCSHNCSFCAIPIIKGTYCSRNISSITQEVKQLVSRGIKEINIISQDSTYFGRDIGLKNGLTLLLKNLIKIKKLEWIRILYGYPEEISDDFLEIMQEQKICSYLDIPFQHSAPEIIKHMKRGLDGIKALKLIKKIRKKLPGVAIRTSLIVGFPGEGKKEFENLKKFVKETKFDHLGVFTYSHEKNTSCYSLGDPVKETIKKRRKEILMKIQAEISYKNNTKYLGRKIDVLIEGRLREDPSILLARSGFQAPEVDGFVYIDNSKNPSDKINTIQKVEITESDVYDLYGKF